MTTCCTNTQHSNIIEVRVIEVTVMVLPLPASWTGAQFWCIHWDWVPELNSFRSVKYLFSINDRSWLSLSSYLNANCIITYHQSLKYTLTRPFIWFWVPDRTSCAFRTALILCGRDSIRCWKHSSEIHIDGTTQLLQICQLMMQCCECPVPPHPRGALLAWDLMTRHVFKMFGACCHVMLSCWK